MPEVKRFFFDSVLKGEYGDKLTVKFIPGATPELVLYGANDEELSREEVESMSYDELHTFVQLKGFERIKIVQQEQEDDDYANAYADDLNDAAGSDYEQSDDQHHYEDHDEEEGYHPEL